MKKLIIIIIGAFTLLFGVNVKGSTFYTLDTPITELNNHTLSEVFQNRNMAMPDLTDKIEISAGVYRLYNGNGVTVDYNIINGEYKINGTVLNGYQLILFDVLPNTQYAVSYIAVSGTLTGGSINLLIYSPRINFINQVNENRNKQNTFITTTQTTFRMEFPTGRTFDNYIFKLQLEKGSTATPYQVPTNGPYSEIDISTLNLTVEKMDYWFNVYQDLLKDIDRVSQIPNLFIDLFNEITDNFVIGIKGFTQLIYLPGYGLTDLGIISLIVVAISAIGISVYIIRKVIK